MPALPSLPIIGLHRHGTRPDIPPTTGRITGHAVNGSRLGSLVCIEPPWRGNRRSISCIPPGIYRLRPRRSPKFGDHLDVIGEEPARSFVLIHAGNDLQHTRGCILPGTKFGQTDRDAAPEVLNSRAALATLRRWVGEEAWLVITADAEHKGWKGKA